MEKNDPHWKFSKMTKNEPFYCRPNDSTSESQPDGDAEIADTMTRLAVTRKVEDSSIDQLYSVVMGLPGRVRQYMRRVRKLRSQGLDGDKLAEELSPIANKILTDRLEAAVLVPARLAYDGKSGDKFNLSDDRLVKMTNAAMECDALLTLLAPHFLPGITCRLAISARAITLSPTLRGHISGLADVLDYGAYTKAQRGFRRQSVVEFMKREGWELPNEDEEA